MSPPPPTPHTTMEVDPSAGAKVDAFPRRHFKLEEIKNKKKWRVAGGGGGGEEWRGGGGTLVMLLLWDTDELN